MIVLTREEFLERTGIDLNNEVEEYDSVPEKQAEIILTRWSKILYGEVLKNSLCAIPDDDKLKDNQVEIIKEVLCNLGLYYKNLGDIKALGSMDENGNYKKAVPEDLLDDLRHCGLIRKSFGRRAVW